MDNVCISWPIQGEINLKSLSHHFKYFHIQTAFFFKVGFCA